MRIGSLSNMPSQHSCTQMQQKQFEDVNFKMNLRIANPIEDERKLMDLGLREAEEGMRNIFKGIGFNDRTCFVTFTFAENDINRHIRLKGFNAYYFTHQGAKRHDLGFFVIDRKQAEFKLFQRIKDASISAKLSLESVFGKEGQPSKNGQPKGKRTDVPQITFAQMQAKNKAWAEERKREARTR